MEATDYRSVGMINYYDRVDEGAGTKVAVADVHGPVKHGFPKHGSECPESTLLVEKDRIGKRS